MSEVKFHPFDPLSVPLEGSNLIEASAGTGKTYSIAILALRLILEKNILIREILMVTFTKAAVAELEERIRKFIRSAYKCAQGETINDLAITGLVKKSVEVIGKEKTCEKLKEAILFLDETSVLTIHSFCQQTLTEFAFETSQLFGADILQDFSPILETEVQKFWRKYITTIPQNLLSILIAFDLSQSSISTLVKHHLEGKRFIKYVAGKEYSWCEEEQDIFLKAIDNVRSREEEIKTALVTYVIENKTDLMDRASSNAYLKKHNVADLIADPESFIDYLFKKSTLINVKKAFEETGILDKCDECIKIRNEIKEIIRDVFNHIYCLAISEISKGIEKHKLTANELSYDDLIVNLHRALSYGKNRAALVSALQKKYKAIFIDEFQDTDKLQYEIFKNAFGKNTILFYIGDPKQSIYAWRKADIFTYFKAYKDVDAIYDMNVNYRSTERMIAAMNGFFLPEKDFDTFYFEDQEDKIIYKKVEAPATDSKGEFMDGDKLTAPITINIQPNKTKITEAVVARVVDLLRNDNYKIGGRTIRPSDIGILVRSKSEGFKIKEILSSYHIPAVTVTDAKVLQSAEALDILYLMEAILDPSSNKINRALLSSFTGFQTTDIQALDSEKVSGLFKNYHAVWNDSGIYEPLHLFIREFGVQKHLLQTNTEKGERIITNLYQLIELLFKTESNKSLSAAELVDWLKRAMEEKNTVGDELEQRIENDEEAVKISTIHSSKGLQYPIVIAPFLDLLINSQNEDCSFRDEETSEYISALKVQLNEDQITMYNRQTEQENRRLIYVAVTRAVYKCFIYKNSASRMPYNYSASSLAAFVSKINPSELIQYEEPEISVKGYFYQKSNTGEVIRKKNPVHFRLLQRNWQRMSYTRLAADQERRPRLRALSRNDPYDQFVFSHLTRGNITGNMLHFIFENIHFADDNKWPEIIDKAIKRFAPASREIYERFLPEMIRHVTEIMIRTGDTRFKLKDISFDQRIHEMEFDFPVSVFDPAKLAGLAEKDHLIFVKSLQEIEGMMNGLIDLFFEYERKYYILDWKSNYLGDTREDYNRQALEDAMNEHNYHLQYLLYTVALKKYLQSRLPDFDYERDFGGVIYLFIRGIRKDGYEGVFFTKPTLQTIKELEETITHGLKFC